MKRCSTRGTAYAGSGIDCDEQYNYFRMGSASYRRRRRWIYTRTGWRKHWTVPRTCTIFYTGCTERTTLRRPRCFTAGDFVLRVKLRNARTCSAEQSPPTHTHTLGATAHVCQKFYDVKILKNKENISEQTSRKVCTINCTQKLTVKLHDKNWTEHGHLSFRFDPAGGLHKFVRTGPHIC